MLFYLTRPRAKSRTLVPRTNQLIEPIAVLVRAGRHVSACAVSTQRARVFTIRTCISKPTGKRNGGGAVARRWRTRHQIARETGDGLSPRRHKRCRYYG